MEYSSANASAEAPKIGHDDAVGFLRWPWTRDDPGGQSSLVAHRATPKPAPTTALPDRDAQVWNALVSAGADLSKPRHVIYFLYFTSSVDAEAAADRARQLSFLTEIGRPSVEYPDQWSVICEKHGLVLSTETVRTNTEFFGDLASAHHGEFDGWEASV